MGAIEMLMTEHRLILKVLGAMEKYVEAVVSGQPVDRADLEKFVTFIREFADRCHHGKEEDILFASMVEQGYPREQGPVAVMLAEHEQGRQLVGVLKAIAAKSGAWTEEEKSQLIRAALGYISLLRSHIHKEDHVLYPAAENHLGPERMEAMAEEFEVFEQTKSGAGEHERFHALADELIARYNPEAKHSASCHHQ
ncbi:MAG TPA: hemerythrin domain-containing protein [Candidatus Acidoferrum sp.]|nr:hemerythrin domain-containing protein [Candidatus Acidoferrum sp.]